MTHLEGRILEDVLIGTLVLWIGMVIAGSIRDSLGRRKDNTYDKIKAFEKLPETGYKDFGLLDKTIMVFLPTHLWHDYQPDDNDTKILNLKPLKLGQESSGITYKLYKGHKVLIKRVKLQENRGPF